MSSTSDLTNLKLTPKDEPSSTITKFTWTIENFCTLDQTRYDSPVFSSVTDKTKFFLAIHPKGSHSFWNNTHTLIYIYLKSCDKDVLEARYKVSILNAKGERCHIQEGKARFRKQSKWTMEFNWQYNVLRDYLLDPKNGFLTDGKLVVQCEVQILDTARKYLESEPYTIEKVSSDLHTLLLDRKLCDVTLVVGGKQLKAHKTILAARSPVFAAMFEHETKEKVECVVEITDLDVDVCEQLLGYIYSGRIPSMEQYAQELLAAADKYQMDCLKSICEQHLCASICIELVSGFLLLADMHNASDLKGKCIEHITSYPNQVMATEGWKALAATRPELGLQLFQYLAVKTCK